MTGRHPSRRDLLGGIAVAALPAAVRDTPPLARLAAAKGVTFGTAVGGGRPGSLTGMLSDPRMMAVVAREAGAIVAENEMKPYVIAQVADARDFAPGDRIADWARMHGKRLRGHTLLWNTPQYVPQWLEQRFADAPAAALAAWLERYVGDVVGHFGPQVHAWDVVNETVDPATGAPRDTVFQRKLGFEALRIAFETARARAPHARRVYNDFMSWGEGSAAHRAGVLRLLERFRRENVPVDALGVQSHIGTEQSATGSGGDMAHTRTREREWRAFLDAVTAMGYRLAITEFDVSDRRLAGSIAARDAEVAAVGKGYLDLMLSYRQLDGLICWGLVDRYSWLQGFSPRDDRQPLRPLPFDDDYRPKPLRNAIAAALKAAPAR